MFDTTAAFAKTLAGKMLIVLDRAPQDKHENTLFL